MLQISVRKTLVAEAFRLGRDSRDRPLRFANVPLSCVYDAIETGSVSAVLSDPEITNPALEVDLNEETVSGHKDALFRSVIRVVGDDTRVENTLGFQHVVDELCLFAVLAMCRGTRPTPDLQSVVSELFSFEVCKFADDRVALANRLIGLVQGLSKRVTERGVIVFFDATKISQGDLPIEAVVGIEILGDEEFDKLADLQAEMGLACPC